MSSNIISRNHVRQLLQNYKKQVSQCETTAPLNVSLEPICLFQHFPMSSNCSSYYLFRKSMLVLDNQLIRDVVSSLASELCD